MSAPPPGLLFYFLWGDFSKPCCSCVCPYEGGHVARQKPLASWVPGERLFRLLHKAPIQAGMATLWWGAAHVEGVRAPTSLPSLSSPAQRPARWSGIHQTLWPRGLRKPGPWGSLVSTPLHTAVGKLSSTLGSRNFLHSCPAQSVWQREKQGFSELKLHGYHGALGCLSPRTELPWHLPGLA